jgi:2-polyprenyl-3-methyl-5-hydroxy-6-metoxy-1,4-benzoquinol methylase
MPTSADVVPWKLPPLPGESETTLRERRNRAMFGYQLASTAEFWRRVGIEPDVKDARVLDLGCGHGVLTVDLAQRGAKEVVGLDLDVHALSFAQNYVPEAFPLLSSKISFVSHDIAELAGSETFDFVFSKDAFEHILDLEGVVGNIRRVLKPGGKLILGTSPLYFSAFGDHDLVGYRIPWLTTIIPEPLLYRFAAWKAGTDWYRASDAGLNKMTPAKFRSLFPTSNWRIQQIKYNAGINPMVGSAFAALRSIPFVEKFVTVSIYAVIERI